MKTVYFNTKDNAIFSFEIQELTEPAISSYTALQLLDSGEGQATCLLCRKTYAADQLTRFAIGAGDSPFNVQNRPVAFEIVSSEASAVCTVCSAEKDSDAPPATN